jgi:hypothetical protein
MSPCFCITHALSLEIRMGCLTHLSPSMTEPGRLMSIPAMDMASGSSACDCSATCTEHQCCGTGTNRLRETGTGFGSRSNIHGIQESKNRNNAASNIKKARFCLIFLLKILSGSGTGAEPEPKLFQKKRIEEILKEFFKEKNSLLLF